MLGRLIIYPPLPSLRERQNRDCQPGDQAYVVPRVDMQDGDSEDIPAKHLSGRAGGSFGVYR